MHREGLTVELVVARVQLAEEAERLPRRYQLDSLPPEHLPAVQTTGTFFPRLWENQSLFQEPNLWVTGLPEENLRTFSIKPGDPFLVELPRPYGQAFRVFDRSLINLTKVIR